MVREPIPSWYYSLVVVKDGDRFLIVQERKHDQTWYLPAGRVERGETFEQAARRETLEESGLRVELTHIIRVEHTAKLNGTRMRVVFLARPIDKSPPKSVPDEESMGAAWTTLENLHHFSLRAAEVRSIFESVANDCPLYPLEIIKRGSDAFEVGKEFQ